MKKRWVSTDAWRGHYEPVPPEGWELLVDCSVVNDAGNKLRWIITQWLKGKGIKYRAGYLRNSNVFSSNLYIIIESEKLTKEQKERIEDWFVNNNNSTFSIFSGESWELDQGRTLLEFTEITKS